MSSLFFLCRRPPFSLEDRFFHLPIPDSFFPRGRHFRRRRLIVNCGNDCPGNLKQVFSLWVPNLPPFDACMMSKACERYVDPTFQSLGCLVAAVAELTVQRLSTRHYLLLSLCFPFLMWRHVKIWDYHTSSQFLYSPPPRIWNFLTSVANSSTFFSPHFFAFPCYPVLLALLVRPILSSCPFFRKHVNFVPLREEIAGFRTLYIFSLPCRSSGESVPTIKQIVSFPPLEAVIPLYAVPPSRLIPPLSPE